MGCSSDLLRLLSSCLNRCVWNSFVSYRGTKEMPLTTQVETLHVVSHFSTKHLVLWTTPKTLDLQGRNHLKDLKELGREFEMARLPTHEKSNCPLSILSYLRQNSQLCLSHRCKQWQKKDEFVKRDWIENFRPVWQRTIGKELTQDKASRDYICHAICYLFKKLKRFFF